MDSNAERERLVKEMQETILKASEVHCDMARLSYEASWGNNRRRYDWIESLQVHLGETIADFILADRRRVLEEIEPILNQAKWCIGHEATCLFIDKSLQTITRLKGQDNAKQRP